VFSISSAVKPSVAAVAGPRWIVCVLEGPLGYTLEGQRPATLKAGEALFVPASHSFFRFVDLPRAAN
jgi:hypothetical protein